MSALHPAQLPTDKLLADCEISRTRGSGPGGQHRNKVETAIVVKHRQTGIRGEASERRSQKLNRERAIFRLRVKLALDVRTEAAEEASSLWRSRTKSGRISVSADHEDFPSLLAEALNMLAENDYATTCTAKQLGISTSQLVKFLKIEPTALAKVNRERQTHGDQPLR